MKRRQILGLPALFLLGQAHGAEITTLEHGGWAATAQSLAGRPAIVHLWGLSCAPCVRELPRWATFVQQNPSAQMLFIQFEPASVQQVRAALRRVHLEGARHMMVGRFPDERLQFEVDPDWGGELPRTLLIAADGKRQAFSGTADFAKLKRWL
ncbi:MAG: hypothetical protein KGL90_13210 [Burkholderiales bacterium]|nr:hypothetical protein [Burkholderiales bacterium]